MTLTTRMTVAQRKPLLSHLSPGDGCEDAAILLCARRAGQRLHRLHVRKIAEELTMLEKPIARADGSCRRAARFRCSYFQLLPHTHRHWRVR